MPPPHRIDAHHHVLPPRYLAEVGEAAVARTLVSGAVPAWTPGRSIEAMDRNGIAAAVVSISAPGFAGLSPPARRALCRHCNEYMAELGQTHPGRFGSFSSLPLPDVDAGLEELAFALDHLGAAGVCLLTNHEGTYLGDPAFEPVLAELDRRGAVAFVHPAEGPGSPLLGLPAATLEFPFDTTRAVADLLLSGALHRHPRIRFVFSHAGGAVPFLAERLARLERRPAVREAVPDGVLATLRRLRFDTALSAGPMTLAGLLRLAAPGHVLFGSDHPHAPEEAMAGTVSGLAAAGLPEAALRAIERDNALALFPGLR